jgi:hypothetical protein
LKKSTQWDIVGVLGIALGVLFQVLYQLLRKGFYIGNIFYSAEDPTMFVFVSILTSGFGLFCFALGFIEGRGKLPQHS